MSTNSYKSVEVRHNPGVSRSSFIVINGPVGDRYKLVAGPSLATGPDAAVLALGASEDLAAEIISDGGAAFVASLGEGTSGTVPLAAWWSLGAGSLRSTTHGTSFILQREVSAGPEVFETVRLLFVEGTETSRVKWQVLINGVWTNQPDMATVGMYREVVRELPSGPVAISSEMAITSSPAMVALRDRFLNVLVPATL